MSGRGRSRGTQNQSGAGRGSQNQSGGGRGSQNQSGGGRGPQNQSGGGRGPQNQSGGGRGPQNQSRGGRGAHTQSGDGRGSHNQSGAGSGERAQQTAFVAAPVQASVWGTPAASAPAPVPVQSAWGQPAASRQSAWGPPAGASRPPAGASRPPAGASGPPAGASGLPAGTSGPPAWGPRAPASAATNGQSSTGRGEQSGNRGGPSRPQQHQPQRSQQEQPQNQRSQAQQDPTIKRGYSGLVGTRDAAVRDRGSTRGRRVVEDIRITKPASINSKIGTNGRQVELTANYYRLVKKPTWQIYQYRVDFNPVVEIAGLRNRLIAEQKATLGGYLFDGTMLFLTVKLENEITEFMSKDREGNPIQTTVKLVQLVSMTSSASVQILNLILRRSMGALNLQLVGRNYFDALAKISLTKCNLELWPGYVTSIRQHEEDILMCAEVTTKVMRTETILNIMERHYRNGGDWQTPFADEVIGMTVLTSYNNKTYRIDDIDHGSCPMSTFVTKDGPITYFDYYRTKYAKTIENDTQPLLISRAKERDIRAGQAEVIALVPELCRATGMTDEMRNNRRLMDDVAVYTRLRPADRIQKLHALNRRLQTAPDSVAHLAEWNFCLDTNLVKVKGRELPNETVMFANGKTCIDSDWSQSFRNNSMYTSQHLDNWVVIVPRNRFRQADEFIGIVQQASKGMSYRVADPFMIEINDDRPTSYAVALDKALNRDPQLIMCILISFSADKYSMIKKKCCVERAIPSQVMLSKTITPKPGRDSRSLLSVGTKVGIQMNCKLGGCPWMVDIPIEDLMVVGFDVCHDTRDKNKSYGAMVATMNMQLAQNFFSAVSPHKDGNELSNELALNLIKALKCYGYQHKYLPAKIMIYRDGVGEGQTNFVYEHELKNIIDKLDGLYNRQPYQLTFIIVSKRINTRFFKGSENPIPGTVVDNVVTLPERYDFFLIPQTVRAGTVSPTNFNVIHDGSKLPPSRQQQFAYKMCHLYYNWSGTLAVPAVCQYAHKLAFLVGNYIHQSPSHLLEKKLYFL